jgi:hypothetical protein
MHVLIDDDLGRLTLRRLWPWHRLVARCLAPSLDRQLADGVRPEVNAVLAARAMVLTSVRYRHGLAASLRRMLAASVSPQTRPRLMAASRSAGIAAAALRVLPNAGPTNAPADVSQRPAGPPDMLRSACGLTQALATRPAQGAAGRAAGDIRIPG